MCGRFTQAAPPAAVARLFALDPAALPDVLQPRYNVAPTQIIAVVGRGADGRRGLVRLRWGFVPHWSQDVPKAPLVNARAETVHSLPTFREAFRSRRCLIPADGFYEWQTVGKGKVAHHIRMRDRSPFAFAGLWDRWEQPDGKPLFTCLVLTTAANDLIRPLHDRMPVIVPPEHFDAWLDPEASVAALRGLLVPFPADGLEMVPVGPLVNSPKHDGPGCLTPAA